VENPFSEIWGTGNVSALIQLGRAVKFLACEGTVLACRAAEGGPDRPLPAEEPPTARENFKQKVTPQL
jgi:hypothetical protein